MVLIQSICQDITTNIVVRWLLHYDQKFLRLNENLNVRSLDYIDGEFVIVFQDGFRIPLHNITSYWYRRGAIRIKPSASQSTNKLFDTYANRHIDQGNESLEDFFYYSLRRHKRCLGDFKHDTKVNKHIILSTALECGLKTPAFIITCDKGVVRDFIEMNKRIITKPLDMAFVYETKKYWYPTYTVEVDNELFAKLPQTFKPTLFQTCIEKKLEVRTFYLSGELYSMAIFSQNDERTKTDYRVYNHAKPVREVPFKLPDDVSSKIIKLMKALKLESGSIDIVYAADNNFYFLEVNPIGQFGSVSYHCNYFLERQIAKFFQKQAS